MRLNTHSEAGKENMTDITLLSIGLGVGLVLGGGLIGMVMVSLGGSEAIQIMKARMNRKTRLFEIIEPNGRVHFACVKRDDVNPLYDIKKYNTIVPNPTQEPNVQPKRGEKGLEIWTCSTETPLLIDVPQEIFTKKCLDICHNAYPELKELPNETILQLLATPQEELMHDCAAICGRNKRPVESIISKTLSLLDGKPPEVWEDVINALDDELKQMTEA